MKSIKTNSLKNNELERIKSISDKKEIEKIFQLADMVDIYPLYQKWKKDANWIDYGDLIANLWNLIETNNNVLIELQVEGDSAENRNVVLKEFQTHPLKSGWLHIDFLEIVV